MQNESEHNANKCHHTDKQRRKTDLIACPAPPTQFHLWKWDETPSYEKWRGKEVEVREIMNATIEELAEIQYSSIQKLEAQVQFRMNF